jgi:hypothetical protein
MRAGRAARTISRNRKPAQALEKANVFQEPAMSKSHHDLDNQQQTQNQNNAMSEDPGDGSRNADVIAEANAPTPMEKKPPHDAQDQSTIEAFGEEGAGVAAKE